MSPLPPGSSPMSPGAAPLPPLPNLSGNSAGMGSAPGGMDPMAGVLAGVAPVKHAVDMILAACKSVVQSGVVPGSEQVCGQIVALATSLLPMAVQQAMQPGSQAPGMPGGGGGIPGVQGM